MNCYQYFRLGVVCLALLVSSSCTIDEIVNPNGPTLESLENGATLADLRLLASGSESILRNDMEFYYQTVSIVGREYYDLNGIDPRYTGELLGEQGAELDNNGFLTTRSFAARYRAIRNLQVLLNAVQNTAASLTPAQENGFLGFAKTLQAYSLLLVLNRQFDNGIRLNVVDPDNLGPFVSYSEGLNGIQGLLSEADGQLANAGAEFPFALSSGMALFGFDTPANFRQFNRALAARVALYQGNKAEALGILNNSFLDLNGDLDAGPYHAFGTSGNDIRNPLFYVLNNDLYTVHPDWLANAEAGDTRVDEKTTPLDPNEVTLPVILAGLEGTVQVTQYNSETDPVPIIRNEELVLIYAEANIGTNTDEVTKAINVVRNAAGLSDYAGGTDDASLLNEVLKQRRYSLFGEGHFWIDMRRTNRLNEIPTDRSGDVVHRQFPRPVSEDTN